MEHSSDELYLKWPRLSFSFESKCGANRYVTVFQRYSSFYKVFLRLKRQLTMCAESNQFLMITYTCTDD